MKTQEERQQPRFSLCTEVELETKNFSGVRKRLQRRKKNQSIQYGKKPVGGKYLKCKNCVKSTRSNAHLRAKISVA